MVERVTRRGYDNTRRREAVRVTRLRVIGAAKTLFLDNGYPATTIEAIAEASGAAVPTVYRLFGTKRGLLKEVLDTSLVGDDEPVPFGERAAVKAALGAGDAGALIDAFAVICREVKNRATAIHQVLATAAVVDSDAAQLLAELRTQAHTGRSRIVAALRRLDALDPVLTRREAEDIVYTCLSFEVAHILTVERGWSDAQYEAWIARSLRTLLRPDLRRVTPSRTKRPSHEET
jgi:TetR/AcrR family transcriptional regulator, regulator of autoinduction and epiphytic fitness